MFCGNCNEECAYKVMDIGFGNTDRGYDSHYAIVSVCCEYCVYRVKDGDRDGDRDGLEPLTMEDIQGKL